MVLIKENAAPVFDRDQVGRGDLIRAKHETWNDFRNGLVVGVTDTHIICLYYTGYGNVSNHYIIPAAEVSRGEWEIAWTSDMGTIYELKTKTEEEDAEADSSEEITENADEGGATG